MKSAAFGYFCPVFGCALNTFDVVLYQPYRATWLYGWGVNPFGSAGSKRARAADLWVN